MTRHQTALFRQVLLVLDVLLSAAAFSATLAIREWLPRMPWPLPSWMGELAEVAAYDNVLLGMLPLWALAFYWCRTSDFRTSSSVGAVSWRYLRAIAVGIGLLVVASFWFKWSFLSRSFVFLLGGVQFVTLMLGRFVTMEVIKRSKRVDDHRVLIVGCGPAAVAFARSLRERSAWNNRLIGHLCVPGEERDATATPLRGDLLDLAALLDSEVVDEVVFAAPGRPIETFQEALEACDLRGVDVLVTMHGMVPTSGRVELANVTGFDMPMLGCTRVPTSQGLLLLKRALDIAGSLAAIILFAPLMIAAAIAIKLDSPGDVLFKQVRSGRNGRKFVMYKFRSMCVDAEARRAELEKHNEMDGPVFKMKSDPRITRIGKFIRKTSIDELPQFFNVLLGDMSLVGPRPPLPSEVAQYEAWQRRRLSVRPGITGAWQVSGRNNIDFAKWMELDLHYIDNWSLWLDVKILFQTLPAVLMRSGAS
jgi:exopolysaccharide biosynthesis polyprenyl glycosylphosphotransferase